MEILNINSNIFSNAVENNTIPKPITAKKDDNKLIFEEYIEKGIAKVNESQVTANNKIESLIKGEGVSMHEVMLSIQESQMSMQLVVEVRKNLYGAYQKRNRVQL